MPIAWKQKINIFWSKTPKSKVVMLPNKQCCPATEPHLPHSNCKSFFFIAILIVCEYGWLFVIHFIYNDDWRKSVWHWMLSLSLALASPYGLLACQLSVLGLTCEADGMMRSHDSSKSILSSQTLHLALNTLALNQSASNEKLLADTVMFRSDDKLRKQLFLSNTWLPLCG